MEGGRNPPPPLTERPQKSLNWIGLSSLDDITKRDFGFAFEGVSNAPYQRQIRLIANQKYLIIIK